MFVSFSLHIYLSIVYAHENLHERMFVLYHIVVLNASLGFILTMQTYVGGVCID